MSLIHLAAYPETVLGMEALAIECQVVISPADEPVPVTLGPSFHFLSIVFGGDNPVAGVFLQMNVLNTVLHSSFFAYTILVF